MRTLERWRQKANMGTPEVCWVWSGAPNTSGYGMLRIDRKTSQLAHRVGYELLVGPIPEGLQLDHLCRNRLCVNPAHLEPVDSRTNTLRGETLAARQAAQTHCVHGHPFSGENLTVTRFGKRRCNTCNRERAREQRARIVASRHRREGPAQALGPNVSKEALEKGR